MLGNDASNAARNARHRPITWPTGSSLHNPRLTGRTVIPATSPNRSAQSGSSSRGSGSAPSLTGVSATCRSGAAGCAPALGPALDLGTKCLQARIDTLVAALDLTDVLNDRITLRGEGGEQH